MSQNVRTPGRLLVKHLEDPGFRERIYIQQIEQTEPLKIDGETVFDELTVAEYSPDLVINSTLGLTEYRLIQNAVGSGTVSESNGSFKLSTGTTPNSEAEIESNRHGNYAPGTTSLAGIAVRLERLPTGNEDVTWGYYSDDDGIIVGYDADGPYLTIKRDLVPDPVVRRTEWLDPLDGTGASGAMLNLLKPTVWRFKLALYGQGPVEVWAMIEGPNREPVYTLVYRFWSTETDGLINDQFSLPIRADVNNNGDSTDLIAYIGGIHFGTVGRRKVEVRTTAQENLQATLSGTTLVPIVSLRKKSDKVSEAVNSLVDSISVSSADNLLLYVVLNGTLTGASWGGITGISANETKLEADTSATAISGGNAIYKTLITGGSGNQEVSIVEKLTQTIPNNTPVTLAARKISGTGGSGSFILRAVEQW